MERRNRVSLHNPLSKQKESKLVVQEKLKKRRERDETRKEQRRLQTEENRQKHLKEKKEKSQERSYFSKDGEKERRSWILGIGNVSPTQEASPKVDCKRRQYNKAMKKLYDATHGRKSACSEASDSSNNTPEPRKNRVVSNHEEVYHSSQFQVSDLIPQPKADTVFCRICQSEEDSLENQLVTPCNCTGSLRYVHHLCLQQWRKTKKASGADISKCELCLQKYDTELLGKSDVKPDQTRKMQEDLRRLVRSGVYLMLLVDFCRDSFQDLLQERESLRGQSGAVAVPVHPPTTSLRLDTRRTTTTEATESSDDNEDYVSRDQLKQRSEEHRRLQ